MSQRYDLKDSFVKVNSMDQDFVDVACHCVVETVLRGTLSVLLISDKRQRRFEVPS